MIYKKEDSKTPFRYCLGGQDSGLSLRWPGFESLYRKKRVVRSQKTNTKPDWLNWIERKTSKRSDREKRSDRKKRSDREKRSDRCNLEVEGSSPSSGKCFQTAIFTKSKLYNLNIGNSEKTERIWPSGLRRQT